MGGWGRKAGGGEEKQSLGGGWDGHGASVLARGGGGGEGGAPLPINYCVSLFRVRAPSLSPSRSLILCAQKLIQRRTKLILSHTHTLTHTHIHTHTNTQELNKEKDETERLKSLVGFLQKEVEKAQNF